MLARRSRHNAIGQPRLAGWLALALLLAAMLAPATPVAAQGAVSLANADLEEGFVLAPGGRGSVAAGWEPWWVEGSDDQAREGALRPPTFAAEAQLTSPHGVHSRALAQSISSLYATHEAGIYQRVAARPGDVVRFAMWVHVWSSSNDDTDRSFKPGDYRVSVGIDPYGGADPTSDTVVWSPEIVQYDEWLKLAVSATAGESTITVFARGACSWRVKHNTAIWDDATIVLTAASPSSDAPAGAPPALAAVAGATPPAEAATVARAATPNALANPDLEEGFVERGAGEVSVARGWEPWWDAGSAAQTAEGYLFRPEFKPEQRGAGSGRVHAMNAAQKQFNTYATHRAGIYQRAPVSAGARVTFAMWAYVWSSAEDDPEESATPGDYRISVGIDPTGGVDATAAGVVWSQPRQAYDRWVELTVSATAEAPYVTVFTRGEPGWRVKHNDSYWDDATLIVEGAAAPVTGQASPPGIASAAALPATAIGAAPAAAPRAAGRPAGNLPNVARAPQPLGQEASLSYAGAHLSLRWQREPDGVTIAMESASTIAGELALYHERRELARWAITLAPSDPLTLEWPAAGLDRGELGVQVSDSAGNVLARCGTLP